MVKKDEFNEIIENTVRKTVEKYNLLEKGVEVRE